jgi:hypothetical protein
MDIPRTYLEEIAKLVITKLGKEHHPTAIEQAVIDLRGQVLIDYDRVVTLDTATTKRIERSPFENAAIEALEQLPLKDWLAAWHAAQAETQPAIKAKSEKK